MERIHLLYKKIKDDIEAEINSLDELYIANTDTKEFLNYLCAHRIITPVERDNSLDMRSEFKSRTDTDLPNDYKAFQNLIAKKKVPKIEILYIDIPLKLSPNNKVLCEYVTFIDEDKSVKLFEDRIIIKMIISKHSQQKNPDEVEKETEKKKRQAFEWINLAQQTIAMLNSHLTTDIEAQIEKIKSSVLLNQKRKDEIIKKINIPLKRKEDEVIKRINLDKSPLISRILPSAKQKEDYVLDRQKLLDIISVIDNQGRQFEKTPMSYKRLNEEDLRNILLVNLNAIFEGKAVGEAFSNVGKTDITLNIDKGNILIIECKVWSGPQNHLAAISQLISYLTWRQNFGIVISFCRIKDLSAVIKNLPEEIKSHPTYSKQGATTDPTHFSTFHQSPADKERNIEIHHVFYNLYTADKQKKVPTQE